ncbi:MAG: hypothetical protein U9R37_04520 [Campylobacterota bacterium]|nr:hypothetical protein [Campylobacterota bacterium]
MLFKKYFENLSLKEKVQLYLLVFMFYGTVVYFFDDLDFKYIENKVVNSKDIETKDKISEIKNKFSKKDKLFILKKIENQAISFDVIVDNIKFKENCTSLSLKGKYLNVVNLVQYYDIYFIIKSLQFEYKDKELICKVKLDTKYIYNDENIYTYDKNIPNPFVYNTKSTKEKKNNKLVINAILNNKVLIDNNWYAKDDIVNKQKIIKIDINYIEVLKSDIIKRIYI